MHASSPMRPASAAAASWPPRRSPARPSRSASPAEPPPGDAADRYVAGGPVVERQRRRAGSRRGAARHGPHLPLSPRPARHRLPRASSASWTGSPGPPTTRSPGPTHGSGPAPAALRRPGPPGGGGRLRLAGVPAAAPGGRRLRPGPAAAASRPTSGWKSPGRQMSGRLPDDTGWTVTWPRAVDGDAGPGRRRPDRPLAGRPDARDRPDRARPRAPAGDDPRRGDRAGQADRELADLFGSRAGEIRDLRPRASPGWPRTTRSTRPRPDAPAPRCAWPGSREARTSGELAESLRAVKLYLDAGTGALIGGDVLR